MSCVQPFLLLARRLAEPGTSRRGGTRAGLLACAAALWLVAYSPAGAAGVAQVMNARGAQVKPAGKALKPASLMMMLDAGDQVQTAKTASLTVVFYQDGHREELLPDSVARITPSGLQVLKGKKSVVPRRIGSKALQRLVGGKLLTSSPGRPGAVAQRGEGICIRAPLPPAIRSHKPSLVWDAVEGAESYTLTLCDKDDKALADSVTVAATRLAYPAAWPELSPGDECTLNITAERAVEPLSGSVSFRVLAESDAQAVAAEEGALGESVKRNPKDVMSRLLLAQLYEQYRLLGEAIGQVEAIVRCIPDDPSPYHILARLCDKVGLADRARQAEEQAGKLERRK